MDVDQTSTAPHGCGAFGLAAAGLTEAVWGLVVGSAARHGLHAAGSLPQWPSVRPPYSQEQLFLRPGPVQTRDTSDPYFLQQLRTGDVKEECPHRSTTEQVLHLHQL